MWNYLIHWGDQTGWLNKIVRHIFNLITGSAQYINSGFAQFCIHFPLRCPASSPRFVWMKRWGILQMSWYRALMYKIHSFFWGRFQYFAHQSLAHPGAGTLHLELWKFWEETNVGMRLHKEAAAATSRWDCKRLLAPGNRVSGLWGKQGRCCPLASCDTGVRDLDLNWPENLQMKRGASSEFWQRVVLLCRAFLDFLC